MSKCFWIWLLDRLLKREQVQLTSLFTSYTLLFIICPFPGCLPEGQMAWPEGEQPNYNCEGKQSYAKNGRKGWTHQSWNSFPCSYCYTRKINHVLMILSCSYQLHAAKSSGHLTHYCLHSVEENNPDFKSLKIVLCK